MASNRFYTILLVPEKSQDVKKIIIPSYLLKGAVAALVFLLILTIIMVLDYANVMSQISENKMLKVENRQLKQSVQVFKTKLVSLDSTIDRVKTFSTKLKIIANIEDRHFEIPKTDFSPKDMPKDSDETNQPSGPTNGSSSSEHTSAPLEKNSQSALAPKSIPAQPPTHDSQAFFGTRSPQEQKRKTLLASLMIQADEGVTMSDADSSIYVQGEFQKLDDALLSVQQYAEEEEKEAQALLDKINEKRTLLMTTPTRLPTLGYITSEYGVRINPYDGRRKMHEGIDIANRFGSEVFAPADAVVTFAGDRVGYGKLMILDHGNKIETYYAHTSKFFVKSGDRVRRGQRIAAVGNTGHSTGPHLHYEVRAGDLPVDPCWYILDATCSNQ